MWVMEVEAVAPCQCFTPAGVQTTSPSRISRFGPCHSCTQPTPAVTMSTCPAGCVCHALRAPGANVTWAPVARVPSFVPNSRSTDTVPVKVSGAPRASDRASRDVTSTRAVCAASGLALAASRAMNIVARHVMAGLSSSAKGSRRPSSLLVGVYAQGCNSVLIARRSSIAL